MATPVQIIDPPATISSSPFSRGTRDLRLSPKAFSRADSIPIRVTNQVHAQAFDLTAHSVQFVAAPGQTSNLQSSLPGAIRETFRNVDGFNGCMVMISDQEARLVTVVTFWNGEERASRCRENSGNVRRLLIPYVDHWLRTNSCAAHFSMSADSKQE